MNVLVVIGLISVGWLAYDASRRDWSNQGFADATWKWVVGALLLWIVVLPVYLVKRRDAPLKA